jgi:hypothetical protein
VYLLTVAKVPKNFLKEFDKIRRRFLWAGDQELSGGECKVAWTRVCMPPSNGGAGIIDLESFSRALRLRWLWYYWDDRRRPWKNLELPVDSVDTALFDAATSVDVGNGEKATFWTTRWLNGIAPAALYPALFKHSRRKNRTVKEALTDSKWIADVDHGMTVPLISQFVDLAQRLNGVVLRPNQTDKISWLHTSDGQYTARSAYHLQLLGKTYSLPSDYIWRTKAPPKCRFFTWLMLHNRVWTAARLLIREWPNEYFCPLCIRNLETIGHLMQECCYSKTIWEKVGSWISAPALNPGMWNHDDDMVEWFTAMGLSGQGARKDGIRSVVMLTAWMIWKERNNRIFNGSCRSPNQLLGAIQDEVKTWMLAGNTGLKRLLPSSTQELGVMPAGD